MKKKALIIGSVIVAILIFIPFLVNLSYTAGFDISADGLISYIVGGFSAIGTISLSILALYQNKVQQGENEKSQKRLERLSLEANEISQRMLAIEEENNRPFVDVQAIRKSDANVIEKAKRIDVSFIYDNDYYDTHPQFKDDKLSFNTRGFLISNVQDHDIIELDVKDIQYEAISYTTGGVLKQYVLEEVSYSDCGTIRSHENVILYLPFPLDIWTDIANQNDNDDRTALSITLDFVLMGHNCSEYEESVLFITASIVPMGLESLMVSNKRIKIHRV